MIEILSVMAKKSSNRLSKYLWPSGIFVPLGMNFIIAIYSLVL